MKEEKIFSHIFDIDVLNKLRNVVNEKRNLSIEKSKIVDKKPLYKAWYQICTILDRLEDTVVYLNGMVLGKCRSNRSAFDFYEFLNCSTTVIDCIKKLARLYSLNSYNKIEDSTEVFGDVMSAGGNDGYFFDYARSLFAVHPNNTNNKKYNYLKNSLFHCCPYVSWSKNLYWLSSEYQSSDLVAVIYSISDKRDRVFLKLNIGEFYLYLDKWIDYIREIITAIQNYNDQKYDEFRAIKVKNRDDFISDTEFIKYLQEEYCTRFGDELYEDFENCLIFFQNDLTEAKNQAILIKYRNALLYSLKFVVNEMQNMSFEGYENSGIKETVRWGETNLFLVLLNPTEFSDYLNSFYDSISDAYYLSAAEYHYYDKQYAKRRLFSVKESINKYVVFTGKESDLEMYILVCLVQYLDSFKAKSVLNRNVPNTIDFRETVLSDEEAGELLKYDEIDEPPISEKELLDLIESFSTDNN